ncbi:MAG: PAS domain-containing protein [Acidobacteria bacterium]|nr:PAS domain-containing protein [Acidobacteriota bacterium]
MFTQPPLSYRADDTWKIAEVSAELCSYLRCTPAMLLGRDVRDMLPGPQRLSFRQYVADALMGRGSRELEIELMAPNGLVARFSHRIEAVGNGVRLTGFRASLHPAGIEPLTRFDVPGWRWQPVPMAVAARRPAPLWQGFEA